MRFKQYILNENKAFLAQRIGDILNALQELNGNSGGMGTRELVRSAETVVNQIRRILHASWSKTEMPYLPPLQKAGVAIAKAIEEKDDLQQILQSAAAELQSAVAKMGEPINSLGGQEPPSTEKGQSTAPPQEEKKQPKPQQPPAQQPPQGQPQAQPPQPGQPPQPQQPPVAS